MKLDKINDIYKQLIYLSAFLKICPICSSIYKDTLDKMIICKECDRENKIKKILND